MPIFTVSRAIKSEVLLVQIFYETERQFNCLYTNKIQIFKCSFIPTLKFSFCILWIRKNLPHSRTRTGTSTWIHVCKGWPQSGSHNLPFKKNNIYEGHIPTG